MQSVSVVPLQSGARVFRESSNDAALFFQKKTDERVLKNSTQANCERTQKPRIKTGVLLLREWKVL